MNDRRLEKIEMIKKTQEKLKTLYQEQIERRKQWESFKSMIEKWRGIMPNRLDV